MFCSKHSITFENTYPHSCWFQCVDIFYNKHCHCKILALLSVNLPYTYTCTLRSEKFIKSNKQGGGGGVGIRGGPDFYYFYDQNLVICYKICLQTCFTNFWKGKLFQKLRHCLHFTKSKTFSFCSFQSFAKIKNFCNKKYIKLINGGGPNKSGGFGFFFEKN